MTAESLNAQLAQIYQTYTQSIYSKEWEDNVYTGFMISQGELGHNPRASDLFCTFRELVFFFQKLEERKAA